MLDCFIGWATAVHDVLHSQGCWCDAIDPCSGVPLFGAAGERTWSEVGAAAALLGYTTSAHGPCPVVHHPVHGAPPLPRRRRFALLRLICPATGEQLLANRLVCSLVHSTCISFLCSSAERNAQSMRKFYSYAMLYICQGCQGSRSVLCCDLRLLEIHRMRLKTSALPPAGTAAYPATLLTDAQPGLLERALSEVAASSTASEAPLQQGVAQPLVSLRGVTYSAPSGNDENAIARLYRVMLIVSGTRLSRVFCAKRAAGREFLHKRLYPLWMHASSDRTSLDVRQNHICATH